MDGHFRVIGLFLGLVILIGTAAFVMSSKLFDFSSFQSPDPLGNNTSLTDADDTGYQQSRRSNRIQLAQSTGESDTARMQVNRLETLLAAKENALNDQKARVRELELKLNDGSQGQRSASRPSRQDRDTIRQTADNSNNGDTDTPAALRAENDRLNAILLDVDVQEEEYRTRITRLQDSLDEATRQMELLEDGADAELANSNSQQRRRQRIMADFVARLGPDTVPSLIQLLDNDDAGVRVWAADILGQLGDDAEEAVNVLSELLEDSSADVRNAASQAIDSIRGR